MIRKQATIIQDAVGARKSCIKQQKLNHTLFSVLLIYLVILLCIEHRAEQSTEKFTVSASPEPQKTVKKNVILGKTMHHSSYKHDGGNQHRPRFHTKISFWAFCNIKLKKLSKLF